MRFSAQLPTDRVTKGAEFTSAAAIGEMTRALEAAGFDAVYATEPPFPPPMPDSQRARLYASQRAR